MNQESNDFNNKNKNLMYNNSPSNNAPEQFVNQVNLQSTTQPADFVTSNNANNLKSNGKEHKKIALIIAVVTLIVIVSLTLLLINIKIKHDGESNEDETNNTIEITDEKKDEVNNEIKKPHEMFNVKEFNPTIFDGLVYDSNKNEYKVLDLLKENQTICIMGCSPLYTFTSDIESEHENLWKNDSDKEVMDFLMKTLGNPSTIYEFYNNNIAGGLNTGIIDLMYNYNDYIITVRFNDYRYWEGYGYDYLKIQHVFIYTKDRFNSEWSTSFKDYECYGEQLIK